MRSLPIPAGVRAIVALALAVLFGLPHPRCAAEPAELILGREIVFLRPRGTLPLGTELGLVFDLVGRREAEDVTGPIRAHAPFVRAVREYRSWVERSLGRAGPLFIALLEGRSGTAFCVAQPAAVRVKERGGRTGLRTLLEPVIYLAEANLEGIRKDPQRGPDVLCHEIGHAFMTQTYGFLDFPGESPEHLVQLVTREGHWTTKETDPVFAYTEGWAEYVECHYVGHVPSDRLIRIPVEPSAAGQAGREKGRELRLMTAEEIRRHEGAQAYLLFHLERTLQRPEIFQEFLAVMESDRPRTFNGLLRAYTTHHPELQDAVDRALDTASQGAFRVDYTYTREDLKAESSGSWRRLREAVKKRLRPTETDRSK